MKRFWILTLATLLLATFTACDSGTKDTDTTVAAEEVTTQVATEEATSEEATTEAVTEEATTEAVTEEATTEASTEEEITLPSAEETTEEETEPEDVPYDVLVNPIVITTDKKEIHGYNASGEFNFEGGAHSTTENNMFIVTNDRLAKGELTATFMAPAQYVNDNGIIFGMVDDTEEQYFFWEDGPTYYFLFVSDDATLYLAKVSDDGRPWTELQITGPIPNYTHGDVITISVEFDGEGFIDCYANGEWMISYYDDNWSGGSRYGIRCEVPDVYYDEVLVDYEYNPDW